MPRRVPCACALCHIEVHLLAGLPSADSAAFRELVSGSDSLGQYSSVRALLERLRTSPADAKSDELLRDLFLNRGTNATLRESILILAFLPMLHSTIRRVGGQQAGLAQEDITQQALSFLLEYLRSAELLARHSHFAFAISRSVKRQVFAWATHEGGKTGLWHYYDEEMLAALRVEKPFERYALLRHFLNRCVTKGLVTPGEFKLLLQCKLNGTSGEEFANRHGTSSNAARQKLKRLVAKLRRLAH
jgi:DNA-directed RNA polymerase specialized sigma24 family protein